MYSRQKWKTHFWNNEDKFSICKVFLSIHTQTKAKFNQKKLILKQKKKE